MGHHPVSGIMWRILEKKRTEMSWMSLPLLNLFGRMGIRWGFNQLNEDVKPIKNCKTSKSVTHHQPHEVESDGWIPVPSCGCRSQWLAVWCKLESPRGITSTRWDGHICGHVSGESAGFGLHTSLQWDPPKSGGHMSHVGFLGIWTAPLLMSFSMIITLWPA